MKIRKAIIPAAGLGTRFLPATKAQPKEMLPIVDKPTIQYIVEEAVNSGIEDILIITGRNKRAIEDHFDKSVELELELKKKGKENLLNLVEDITNMVDIHYIRQKEPKGLG
ncbi:UTP--glucose-1-phosphate uridylyltransferase, partial [Thermoanaerobacterium thermosaccharolyticum]